MRRCEAGTRPGPARRAPYTLGPALALALALASPLGAQDGALAGRVTAESGEPLPAASVRVVAAAGGGAERIAEAGAAGAYGVQRLPPGRYRATAVHIGYHEAVQEVEIRPGETARVDFRLAAQALPVERLVVEADRRRARFAEEAGLTVQELTRSELRLIPGLAETDVLRAMEVLPGVVSTSDFSSAFNVRGGSADQNLILLDGLPIFNPFHLGGVFSVFNPDMVGRAELLAGGFPARYGGRVSSVVSVESDVSPEDDHPFSAGVSLLATRLTWRGAVPDGLAGAARLRDARVAIGARRSYFDKLMKPFFDFPYHLVDLQGRFEAWAGPGLVGVSGYTGRDVLDLGGVDTDDFPLRLDWRWGNDVIGADYSAILGAGTLLDLRVGHSRFDTRMGFPDYDDTRFGSRIRQTLAAAELQHPLGAKAGLQIGAEVGRFQYANFARSGGTEFRAGSDAAWQLGGYAHAEWTRGRDWLVEAGARADAWIPGAGGATLSLAPRVALKRFLGAGDAAVKLAAGRYTQFLHSIRDEELPIGIDVWVLAGERAPHVASDQLQAGYERDLPRGWHASVEAYYRRFDGVTTNNFAEDPNTPLDDLAAGSGSAYGADLVVRRDSGVVRGFVTASWLRAARTFPDVTAGLDPAPEVTYAPVFDRRLDLDLVLSARLGRGYEGGLRWNYGSGLPHTRPLGSFVYYEYGLVNGGRLTPFLLLDASGPARALALGPRNGERYPAYHRLDLSLRKTIETGWGRATPYLEVLNVYNRKNVLFWFYEYDKDPPVRSGVSMFPVLPTIGLEVRF